MPSELEVNMRKKTVTTQQAIEPIPHGSVLMIGGFMGVGCPERMISEIVRQRKSGLTLISNDAARPGVGIGQLIDAGLVAELWTSHIGTNIVAQKQMFEGRLRVQLIPQGTLAEKIRAGGHGLGGVLTPTGIGTQVAAGKQVIEVEGRKYLLEAALKADFALIRAKCADYHGNLEYALTARNFNPLMAMAANTVIAEAERIVSVGSLSPDMVVTPGLLVRYLVGLEVSGVR